jgi:hypothetical protein
VSLRLSLLPGQQVVQEFREAGAVTPQRAQRFHPRSRAEEIAFGDLLDAGIIREPRRGRYYLDERALASLRKREVLPWW